MPQRCIQGLFDGVHIEFLANLLPGGKVHSVHDLIAATPGRRQIGAMNISENEYEHDPLSIAMLVYQREYLILIDYFAFERKIRTNNVLTNGHSYVSLLHMQPIVRWESQRPIVWRESQSGTKQIQTTQPCHILKYAPIGEELVCQQPFLNVGMNVTCRYLRHIVPGTVPSQKYSCLATTAVYE